MVKIFTGKAKKWWKLSIAMAMISFCVPYVFQILEETVLNHKHNTKVMSKSHQGHLKVKMAENS